MLDLQENKELLQMLLHQSKLLAANQNEQANAMMVNNPEERNEVEVAAPD